MTQDSVNQVSVSLVNEAESECAETDPGMVDAAAMVLVGDVYSLLVSQVTLPDSKAEYAPPDVEDDDALLPFIR